MLMCLLKIRSIFIYIYITSGKQDSVEAITATLEVLPEPFKSMATILVEVCAYAGLFKLYQM